MGFNYDTWNGSWGSSWADSWGVQSAATIPIYFGADQVQAIYFGDELLLKTYFADEEIY